MGRRGLFGEGTLELIPTECMGVARWKGWGKHPRQGRASAKALRRAREPRSACQENGGEGVAQNKIVATSHN